MTSIGLQGIKILRAHKVPKSFLEFVYVVGFGTGVPATLFFFFGGGGQSTVHCRLKIFLYLNFKTDAPYIAKIFNTSGKTLYAILVHKLVHNLNY